jgi:hypothetical protein
MTRVTKGEREGRTRTFAEELNTRLKSMPFYDGILKAKLRDLHDRMVRWKVESWTQNSTAKRWFKITSPGEGIEVTRQVDYVTLTTAADHHYYVDCIVALIEDMLAEARFLDDGGTKADWSRLKMREEADRLAALEQMKAIPPNLDWLPKWTATLPEAASEKAPEPAPTGTTVDELRDRFTAALAAEGAKEGAPSEERDPFAGARDISDLAADINFHAVDPGGDVSGWSAGAIIFERHPEPKMVEELAEPKPTHGLFFKALEEMAKRLKEAGDKPIIESAGPFPGLPPEMTRIDPIERPIFPSKPKETKRHTFSPPWIPYPIRGHDGGEVRIKGPGPGIIAACRAWGGAPEQRDMVVALDYAMENKKSGEEE